MSSTGSHVWTLVPQLVVLYWGGCRTFGIWVLTGAHRPWGFVLRVLVLPYFQSHTCCWIHQDVNKLCHDLPLPTVGLQQSPCLPCHHELISHPTTNQKKSIFSYSVPVRFCDSDEKVTNKDIDPFMRASPHDWKMTITVYSPPIHACVWVRGSIRCGLLNVLSSDLASPVPLFFLSFSSPFYFIIITIFQGIITPTFSPSTWEVEAGRFLWVLDQPNLHT